MSEIFYAQTGSGPAVLLVHGFLGDHRDWTHLREQLAEDYRTGFVDLPGHGRSVDALPAEESVVDLDIMVDALDKVVAEVARGPVSMVGYSMGGRIAMAYALKHPGRVERLVLESASPGLEGERERAGRVELDKQRARRILDEGLESFLEDWYRADLFGGLREHPGFAALLARRVGQDARAMARVIRGMSPGRQTPRWDRLPKLDVPTLWLAGAQDAKYVDIVQRASAAMPRADYAVAPNSGHTIHVERPEWWARRVDGWLSSGTDVSPE